MVALLAHLDAFAHSFAPFGCLGCNPASVGSPFGYLLIPSDTLLDPFGPYGCLPASLFIASEQNPQQFTHF